MENLKKEIHEYMNTSLNSTLSRTINTSLTTFVVLLIIFLFGGEAIKGFMFAYDWSCRWNIFFFI